MRTENCFGIIYFEKRAIECAVTSGESFFSQYLIILDNSLRRFRIIFLLKDLSNGYLY